MPAPCFVWYELTTTEPDAAVEFYKRVLGVQANDASAPGGPRYQALLAAGGPVGGVTSFPPDLGPEVAVPGWTGYVAVDDVDALAARVLAAGGKLRRPPTDIPGVGRFAVVADPQGAGFNLFTPLPASVPPGREPGAAGTVGWHELMTAGWQDAFEFYSGLFGWGRGESFEMGPMGTYQLFTVDGVPSGGMMDKPAELPAATWRYYFQVETVDAAAQRIEAAGGRIVMPAHQVPGGTWIVQALDPQGASFAVMSLAR